VREQESLLKDQVNKMIDEFELFRADVNYKLNFDAALDHSENLGTMQSSEG